MAFDAARERVVLFGGLGSGRFRDTWELTGALWTQVQDSGPAPRTTSAMDFDAARGHVILFGGESSTGLMGDTWRWDGDNWTQVADTGPSPRSAHSLTYDSANQRMLLFGGRTANGLVSDTWAWDGHAWTQLEDIGPSPRLSPAMSEDVVSGRVVLFGGAGPNADGLGDTWAWDGVAWTQVADTGPSARAGAVMALLDGKVTLFGGVDSLDTATPAATHVVHGDSWQWDGEEWTQVQDMGPLPRWLHGMTVDAQQNRLILFGGLSEFQPLPGPFTAGVMADTWSHVAEVAAIHVAPNGDDGMPAPHRPRCGRSPPRSRPQPGRDAKSGWRRARTTKAEESRSPAG